jgi:hypothetical protein
MINELFVLPFASLPYSTMDLRGANCIASFFAIAMFKPDLSPVIQTAQKPPPTAS